MSEALKPQAHTGMATSAWERPRHSHLTTDVANAEGTGLGMEWKMAANPGCLPAQTDKAKGPWGWGELPPPHP